ncbi:uncharacterized protein [Cherax quadricarinatus]|nr:uncharacterized protein LOC128697720 [Cherax quadricarinatus]
MWSLLPVMVVMVAAVVSGINDVFPPPDLIDPDAAVTRIHHHRSDHSDSDPAVIRLHHRRPSEDHRVHNLMLNPQQHSLCELKPIRQIVTHAQCTSKEMENHVCVGTCFSYTVPQTEPETPGDELLDYCDSCQASNFHWSTIQLDCEEYGNAYQVTKKLQMIANCSCSPCNPSRSQQPPTDNEVTYPSNDHHVRELLFKMLPDGHKFKEGVNKPPDVNRELQYTEMSLDILKKKLHTENKEQSLRDQVLLKYPTSFADIEEEEDINNLSY